MIEIMSKALRAAAGGGAAGVSHPAAHDSRWSGPAHWRFPDADTRARDTPPPRWRAAR